ncbi:hypothetical protein HUJ05_003910 [Dendroctonus ponderosae]|nr:hypothetical protein HUJ05_003910 [Dendroctonus ponderosae]
MSSNTSPSHYTEDAFVTDADFKVEINQKMKVPQKISFNDRNGDIRNSWIRDDFNMQVPERILVMGQDQHVGTRAPPREIVFDNSLLASGEQYDTTLPRVATPPRTLTLDKYPYPGIEEGKCDPDIDDHLPVVRPKAKVQLNLNESVYSMTNSYKEATPPLGGGGESLTPAEEVVHLRRQLAKLNRRVMTLELETINRLQKEKIVVGFGIAYFLLKLEFFPGEALELSEQYTGSGTPDIVTLRHPNTGESAVFLFSPVNNSVQEVLTLNEAKRSWFIDESVKSDGKLQLSTPIDPIFLVLPYLRKYCTAYAQPLDQLLRDDEFPETERLLKSSGLSYLTMIADRKGDDELNAFKYNEEKTLNWLKKKTERVADILKQKNIHVTGSGAVSSNFVKPAKSESNDQDAHLRYAHGIVSEYLMDDLSLKLLKFLELPEETSQLNLKRKSSSSTGQDAKKPKLEDENRSSTSNVLDLSKPETKPKPPTLTTKDKARAKAASGSKSISSFFKKS